MPLIPRLWTTAANLVGILLSELLAPLPNALVANENTPVGHHLFNVPIAQREGEVQKDAVADYFRWEAVTAVHVGLFAHERIIPVFATSRKPELNLTIPNYFIFFFERVTVEASAI